MYRMIVVFLCLLGVSECHLTNLTASSIADVIRLGASFASRLLDSKSTDLYLGKYFQRFQDSRIEDVLPKLLRLFGVDGQKVQEWAFRGLVSLLPLMNQVLLEKDEGKKRRRRSPEGFSIFRFIVHRSQVAGILSQMQNPDLIDQLLKESEEKADADCVKLLLCKTKPIIKGMQNSLRFFLNLEKMGSCDEECSKAEAGWKKASLEDRMYFFFPNVSEMMRQGDECDEQYPGCEY